MLTFRLYSNSAFVYCIFAKALSAIETVRKRLTSSETMKTDFDELPLILKDSILITLINE